MGFGPAIVMVLTGCAVAIGLLAVAVRRTRRDSPSARVRPDRDSIEASILSDVLRCGGMSREDAREFLQSEFRITASIVDEIDLRDWAERYGERYGADAAQVLLGAAVKAAVMTAPVVPLAQYNALLDLCFSLGLQTDALARLRARHRFAYVDHARQNRPRSAGRMRRPASRIDTGEMMKLLELDAAATRPEIISAYRRLAGQCHPDRFHASGWEEQQAAAERFIRLTEAYEALLSTCGD